MIPHPLGSVLIFGRRGGSESALAFCPFAEP